MYRQTLAQIKDISKMNDYHEWMKRAPTSHSASRYWIIAPGVSSGLQNVSWFTNKAMHSTMDNILHLRPWISWMTQTRFFLPYYCSQPTLVLPISYSVFPLTVAGKILLEEIVLKFHGPVSPVKLASNLRKIGKIASFKNPTDLDAKKHALLEIAFFTIISLCVNIIFYT